MKMTSKEYMKNYYEKNKKKASDYYKEYNKQNKTENKQKKAEYYKLNKEAFKIRYQKFKNNKILLNNLNNKITVEGGIWKPLRFKGRNPDR